MRVLLLNDGGVPEGGAELQALRTRDLLRDAGHDVRLLAADTSATGAPTRADVTCAGTQHPKLRVLTQTANVSAVAALRRELATFRPDVVHVRMFLTQLSPLILPVLRDVPAVWQVVYHKAICPRGTKLLPDGTRCGVRAGTVCLANRCVTPQSWALDMTQQRLWRRWAHHLDVVVTLSETMRRQLADDGVRGVGVLPNGVRERPMRPPLQGPPTVLFAGRLVPEKGADLLVRAVAAVRDRVPDVRLLVAGDGPQRDELATLVRTLDLQETVTLLGHVSRPEVERHADRAWVQAVPGRWEEPLGNVTLEAMMRGTAPLVTAVGGPAEVVEHERTGVVVPPASLPSLADALAALLTDRERCETLGATARRVALDRYAESRVVDRLERLYAEAIARSTASTSRHTSSTT